MPSHAVTAAVTEADAFRLSRACGGARVIALIWFLFSVTDALRAITYMRSTGTPVQYGSLAAHAVGRTLSWTVVTLLCLWMFDRWPRRGRFLSMVLSGVLLVFGALLVTLFGSALFVYTGFSKREIIPLFLLMLPRDFHNSMMMIVFMFAAAIGLRERHAAERRRLRESQLETELLQAQLHSVSVQLQPHFLFNTLNGVTTMLHKDVHLAETMIMGLGDLLRHSLSRTRSESGTLDDELFFIERYLFLQHTRLGDRLNVRIDASPEARHSVLPPFVLQPLVENAVRHGIDVVDRPGEISIAAYVDNGRLEILICNTAPESLQWRSDGIGLSSVRKRLDLIYGNAHALSFTTAKNVVTVAVSIPREAAAAA